MLGARNLSVHRTALLGCAAFAALCVACDEDECGGSIEDLCQDHPSVCEGHRTFDDALASALEPETDIAYPHTSYIAVCDDSRFVQVGDGYVGLLYSYDASGELIGTDSFTDVASDSECPDAQYGEGATGPRCADPCTLFGDPPLFVDAGPPCEGEIAKPVIEACQRNAPTEYEPACAECACSACYPWAVAPRRAELNDEGVLALDECLAEHCAEPCEID